MTTKATRLVDDQGRVLIPPHIRKSLNLAPGNTVEIDMDPGGTIKIRPVGERCCICGESVDGKHRAEIKAGPVKKHICYNCSQQILKNIVK